MFKHVFISCISFMAGIWLAGMIEWPLLLLYCLALILVALSIYFVFCKPRQVSIPIAALFLVVGMVRFMHADIIPPTDISRYEGQTVTLCGIIDDIPSIVDTGGEKLKIKYILKAETARAKDNESVAVSGKTVLYVQQEHNSKVVAYGDKVEVLGKISLPHAYNNPGMLDTVILLKRQGITARMYGQQINMLDSKADKSWLETLTKWRTMRKSDMLKVMPSGDAAIITGMLFGGYEGIKREIIRDFSSTGIVHILSVSGTHIALVAGVILWLGARLKVKYSLTTLSAALAIVMYAILSGLTPPVVRSAIMGLIALAAVGLKREKDAPNALVLTAVGMLSYQPHLIFDISFQLSFAATAGLVFLYPKLSVLLSSYMSRWLSGALAVTIAAQLAVLPFIAWYFNSFSLSSFIANIIIVPIIEFVVVVGLLGCLLMSILPVIGNMVFIFCSLLIGMVVQLTALLAALPGSSLYIPAMHIPESLVYYSILCWLFNYLPLPLTAAEIVKRWPYRTACLSLAIVAALLLYSVYPSSVTVHFIDVGQGDATLVTTPHGRAILIDTGGAVNADNFDVGEKVTVPYMKHYGIVALDYLFLTHGHNDHAGGAAFIATSLPVRNIMLPKEDYQPAVQALVRATKNKKIIPQYVGQQINLDGVTISVVYAPVNSTGRKINENSSIIKISYGQHSFLITGDIEAKGEAAALSCGIETATVLKVGHHGAKTSSTSQFLRVVSPQYAVISVGYNNQFGHPHPEIIKRLADMNIKVFRTDQQGAITFKTDGNNLVVEPFIKK